MKKLLFVIPLIFVLILTGCSKEKLDQTTAPDVAEIEDTVSETKVDTVETPDTLVPDETADDNSFVITLSDGKEIKIGSVADDQIASLGECGDISEAPSCIHEGYDRVYNYGSFTVTTSPDADGNDILVEFSVNTADCVLDSGITIGSSFEDLAAVFSTGEVESFGNFAQIAFENAALSCALTDGNIATLTFFQVVG